MSYATGLQLVGGPSVPLVVQAGLRRFDSFLKRVSVGYVFSGSQHLGPAKGLGCWYRGPSPKRGQALSQLVDSRPLHNL